MSLGLVGCPRSWLDVLGAGGVSWRLVGSPLDWSDVLGTGRMSQGLVAYPRGWSDVLWACQESSRLIGSPGADRVSSVCWYWVFGLVGSPRGWSGILRAGRESSGLVGCHRGCGEMPAEIPQQTQTFTQCWFNVGPASTTLFQHWTSLGWMSHICRDSHSPPFSRMAARWRLYDRVMRKLGARYGAIASLVNICRVITRAEWRTSFWWGPTTLRRRLVAALNGRAASELVTHSFIDVLLLG